MSSVIQSICTEVGDSKSENDFDNNEQVSILNENVVPSKFTVVSSL